MLIIKVVYRILPKLCTIRMVNKIKLFDAMLKLVEELHNLLLL